MPDLLPHLYGKMNRIGILFFAIYAVACTNQPPNEMAPVQKELGSLSSAEIYTTAKNSEKRLAMDKTVSFESKTQPLENERSIFVNPNNSFQEFLGIGAAVTDASAEVFAQLPPNKQEEFLNAYFGDNGINYTLLRTTIHSADFGSGSYTYIEEGDKDLATFDISHDLDYRIPLIKKIMEKSENKLPLYVSPWSPPAFMKSNGSMLQGGSLLPEFYESWALYYAKFIKAYEALDIPIWGLTIQNEPMAKQRWESCIYSAEQERDFLKNYLGPTLQKEGLGDKKIIVWDHNRDLIPNRANVIFDDPEAAKYAWGIGFHWYETWAGGDPKFDNLTNVTQSYPDKKLLFTEGCNEAFDSLKYEYWPNAERYGRSMITDFNQGTVGWTDWNILLNEFGGPNHVENFCFAPIHADTRSGELIYTPSYYYIGHFSKFVEAGALRISTTSSHSDLLSTTWQNQNGQLVTIVMNPTDKQIEYNLYVNEQQLPTSIEPRAMQTILYSDKDVIE